MLDYGARITVKHPTLLLWGDKDTIHAPFRLDDDERECVLATVGWEVGKCVCNSPCV